VSPDIVDLHCDTTPVPLEHRAWRIRINRTAQTAQLLGYAILSDKPVVTEESYRFRVVSEHGSYADFVVDRYDRSARVIREMAGSWEFWPPQCAIIARQL
jgi:hypothetical protein